ncbi:MAG TPA: SAM-dependent methyltransferase [Pseudonocardiaceae bacterium]|jgi:SAM-dependent methyltransferase
MPSYERAWVPPEVDIERANIARVYDYLLGGAHNFEIDRELAEKGLRLLPNLEDAARFNRAFLHRAVRFCLDQGIRQFLDLGSGVPTVGNVHEVAQRSAPDARVVYVDNEPIAVAHAELLLADNENAEAVHADVRLPRAVLDHPVTQRMLDFEAPLAVLMVALLHSVSDADAPARIVAEFRDAVVPGSYLVLSHGTPDKGSARLRQYVDLYKDSQSPVFQRPHREVVALFDGWELVEPGVVFTPQWRPAPHQPPVPDPERGFCYAGVARKP